MESSSIISMVIRSNLIADSQYLMDSFSLIIWEERWWTFMACHCLCRFIFRTYDLHIFIPFLSNLKLWFFWKGSSMSRTLVIESLYIFSGDYDSSSDLESSSLIKGISSQRKSSFWVWLSLYSALVFIWSYLMRNEFFNNYEQFYSYFISGLIRVFMASSSLKGIYSTWKDAYSQFLMVFRDYYPLVATRIYFSWLYNRVLIRIEYR